MIKEVIVLLGILGFAIGAYLSILSIFLTHNALMFTSGLIQLLLAIVVLLVTIKTPLLTWVESFIKKKPILDVFRPGRKLKFVVPDEYDYPAARWKGLEYYLVPGTEFIDDSGFVHFPVIEVIAPSFSPHVDKALEEIKRKYGIESWNDLKQLGKILHDPAVPEEEKAKVRKILADIDAIFKRWGESFTGDHVASYLSNLSPHALAAYTDQKIASRVAKLKEELSVKHIIILLVIFSLFLVGLYLIGPQVCGGGATGITEIAEANKTLMEVNKVAEANTVLIG